MKKAAHHVTRLFCARTLWCSDTLQQWNQERMNLRQFLQ